MQISSMESEISNEAKRLVQCMSVQCPCGNWIFIGIAGHLRRASDVRFWPELKCPTCVDSFTANQENLELVSVPLLVFERGYCGPEAIYRS
ncbi:MAG: hypothetical protein JWO13_164 [Acidobacteriales bacterium]|nr:hypothetical protein [Terriglobales bacterium]